MKILRRIFLILAVVYPPYIFITPLFTDQTGSFLVFPYGMLLLILLLYTFPTYVAYLEIGYLAGRVAERKKMKMLEVIFDVIGALLSISVIATLILLIAAETSGIFSLHLYLAATLIVLWIVRAIAMKRKPKIPEELKSKSFWISTVVFLLIVVTFNAASYFINKEKNKPDPYEPYEYEQTQNIDE